MSLVSCTVSYRLVAILLCVVVSLSACSTKKPFISRTSTCTPSAHRGDRAAGSDNSEAAIQSAVVHQFPYIEIDVRLTAGNTSVVFHDRTLKLENSSVSSSLIGRTVDSLQDTELKEVKHPDGSRLLTLREALSLVADSHSKIQLDVKPDSEEHLDGVVTTLEADPRLLQRVIIQCQHLGCVSFLQQRNNSVAILARIFTREQLQAAHLLRPAIVQVDSDLLSPALATTVHNYGGRVLVKSLTEGSDSVDVWHQLCSQGADIVLTDYPREFLKVFTQNTVVNPQ